MELLGNLKNTVVNAFNGTTTASPTVTRSDILGLEESERSRRINQVSQTRVDKENAANISGIIKRQTFPVFRGNVSKGYKRVTTRFEEEERRRRLTNKSESSLRRLNANKTSRMLQDLGWPFYMQNHSGPEYLVMDPTKLLEEEEREWRTSNQYWGPTAKHNAAMVANILRWGNFQRNPHSGYRQHVKYLEEKERQDRVANMELSMQNAYNEAGLIKQMGAPFYVQETLGSKRDFSEINKLEELERKRRMENPEEQQLAHELAGLVGGHFYPQQAQEFSQAQQLPQTQQFSQAQQLPQTQQFSQAQQLPQTQQFSQAQDLAGGNFYPQKEFEKELEEQERGRRMMDVRQQNIARQNAKQVSLMVRESSSNKIKGAGPMWFSISRNSMKALEEIERTRRLRDIEGQRFARQHAKLVSDMISGRIAAPEKPSIHAIEEGERQSRLLDRQQQQFAIKNARRVSGLIARHMLMSSGSRDFALALEESERSRRLQDQAQQELARNNARMVSSLVSSLNVAPGNAHNASTEALPTYNAPIASSPVAVDMPLQKEFPRSSTVPSFAPISNIQAQPLRNSGEVRPVTSSPLIASAPRAAPMSAPVSAPMFAPVSAPISAPVSAPISAPMSAPISAPMSGPISAPMFAPVSAPLSAPVSAPMSAPVSAPISAPVSAPVSAPISAPVSAPRAAPVSAPMSAPVSAPLSAPVSAFTSAPMVGPIVPLTTAPVSSSTPISSAPISSTPISSAPLSSTPFSSVPISSTPFSAPISSTPFSSVPISSAPISSAPISSAPISSTPFSSAPISSAPISSVPISSTPISSAPISSAPLSSSPAPAIQPMVLPTTSAPVPVAPLASATTIPPAAPVARTNSFNTVPVDPVAIAHPALGERERKSLLKQAEKHNRKSEKDVRKAEASMLKAEKLHQKGRDAKALKLEGKAERFMKNAEFERRYASGLQGELSNTPAPASM